MKFRIRKKNKSMPPGTYDGEVLSVVIKDGAVITTVRVKNPGRWYGLKVYIRKLVPPCPWNKKKIDADPDSKLDKGDHLFYEGSEENVD